LWWCVVGGGRRRGRAARSGGRPTRPSHLPPSQECGLVAEAHTIDERSEWRSFADEGGKTAVDMNRVGGPTNPLLADGLSTSIGEQGGGVHAAILRRAHARAAGGEEKALQDGFRRVGRLADDLGLVRAVRDRACELYKRVLESAKGLRGRGAAPIAAAAVYIACRQEATPRTFKEIVAVAADADKRDVARAYKAIVKELESVPVGGAVHAADLTRRFCSALGLAPADARAATEAAETACPRDGLRPGGAAKRWDARSPLSLAAAVIFLVTRAPRASRAPSAAEVAAVAGVTEHTLKLAARDMHPDLVEIVPSWWATPAELAAVEAPH